MSKLVAIALALGAGQVGEDQQLYKQFLPRVSSREIQTVLTSPDLWIYTPEITPAYQDWQGALQGVHSPFYNISADQPRELFGNANREFPWGHPFGTHSAKGVRSFQFMLLPKKAESGELRAESQKAKVRRLSALGSPLSAKTLPIVWYWTGQTYSWVFPTGTYVGEVLLVRDGRGYDHTFELRIRKRLLDKWIVDVFRPYPNAGSLAKKLARMGKMGSQLTLLDRWFQEPVLGDIIALKSRHPEKTAFAAKGRQAFLPEFEEATVKELLRAEFHSCRDEEWLPGIFAPTTEAPFHVVPAGYTGGLVEVSRQSCMRCHRDTNQPVDAFERFRDWYGRVRGSDGIFTFHPFDPASISHNGVPLAVKMNADLAKRGIIARFDSEVHWEDYQRISGLD
jgi:hypothetical protein